MGSNTCMNELCRRTTSSECKKGWALKSGGFATLCYNCGSAYENLVFCDTFHLEESGWRECRICGKRIHCGCIASKYLHDYMDFGGVGCISCTKRLEAHFTRAVQFSVVNGRVDGSTTDNGRLMQLCQTIVASEPGNFCQAQKGEMYASPCKIKQEETLLPIREVNTGFANLIQPAVGPSTFSESHNRRPKQSQTSLSFSLSPSIDNSTSLPPCPNGVVEGREQAKASLLQQEQRMHHVLPQHPKSNLVITSEENKGMSSQARAARPPAEGRGRNQLLQRYWPKITDQELQQLSGDLKSTIVPLFEKVLSASDAGRIGRLVLPKACAEAYFPPISQSDGIPIRIQDVKGKDWTFQFRFWPNNNSRMYVLEGVTPCMQNMQLQAGDTVTFSRIDPGGKLVMGFRKATNTADKQDAQTSFLPNDGLSGETLFPGVNESLPTHGVGSGTDEDPVHQSTLIREKKRTRNIGSKSKRLLMHSDDAMVLRITWKEAQELFRPPPTVKPTIVTIEDHEIEEYEEPPVFGKRTIFTSQSSGEQKQWAQCDSCSKWRRLPIDALLPPKWTCSDNIWDSNRFLCSAPEEINPKKMNNIFRVGKHFKKPRVAENSKVTQESEPSGLDALANAAVLGDNVGDSGESSVGATTKHPRHRPGCSCIVCIQPPSGKGRHKPTCMCNVCLTVKRRFKTLMLRKKKQQTERGGEIAQQVDRHLPKEGLETDETAGQESCINILENGTTENGNQMDVAESSTGHLDLNCHPTHEEDMLEESKRYSMESLVQVDTLPVEISFSQNERATLQPCLISQTAGKSEEHPLDEGCLPSADVEQENKGVEGQ